MTDPPSTTPLRPLFEVFVSHPGIPRPVAVRYAWAKNPIANLVGSSFLPAEPFRTDSWEAE